MSTTDADTAMSFLKEYLGRNPAAPYREAHAAAEEAGHKVYPVMYGRAKALLGLIPVKPRGSGRAQDDAGPGHPVARTDARAPRLRSDSPEQMRRFVEAFQDLRRERDDLRSALESIAKILQRTLA